MQAFQNNDRKIYAEMIKSMMLDFVVNDLTPKQLSEKYNMARGTMDSIIHHHKFREKRVQYHEKVLQKSIDKLADRQSSILNKLTNVLQRQVDRIEKQQKEDPNKLIDPNRMKEILTAFALISKEYRLDNGKATENQVHTVRVEMGSVPIVSENHLLNNEEDIVEAETVEPKEKEEIKVVIETKEEVEEDDHFFGSLD
jgi:hypothetical protein